MLQIISFILHRTKGKSARMDGYNYLHMFNGRSIDGLYPNQLTVQQQITLNVPQWSVQHIFGNIYCNTANPTQLANIYVFDIHDALGRPKVVFAVNLQ